MLKLSISTAVAILITFALALALGPAFAIAMATTEPWPTRPRGGWMNTKTKTFAEIYKERVARDPNPLPSWMLPPPKDESNTNDSRIKSSRFRDYRSNASESGWDVDADFTNPSELDTSPRLKMGTARVFTRSIPRRDMNFMELSQYFGKGDGKLTRLEELWLAEQEMEASEEEEEVEEEEVEEEEDEHRDTLRRLSRVSMSQDKQGKLRSERDTIEDLANTASETPGSSAESMPQDRQRTFDLADTAPERLQLSAGQDTTLDAFESALSEQPTARAPTCCEEYFKKTVEQQEREIHEAVRASMNDKLDHAKHGIRDVNEGLGRLVNEIASEHPKAAEPPKVATPLPISTPIEEYTSDNTLFEWGCGCRHHHFKFKRQALYALFWTKKPEPQTRGRFARFGLSRDWQFTWLGLVCAIFAIFLTWLMAELLTCAIYGHPKASSTNTWHPSDPFFPWCLPTKLNQWTGKAVTNTLLFIRDNIDHFLDPEGLRYRPIHPRTAHMGANDWWQGRSGPVGRMGRMDPGIMSDAMGF